METSYLKSGKRILELDAARGILMILMALDHSSSFIGNIHFSEMWALPMPDYGNSLLAFFTRWITHPCAPGFTFLMGTGMILFVESRIKRGWKAHAMLRHFFIRGFILLFLSLTLENFFWNWGFLTKQGGPKWFIFFTIISTLGISMMASSLLMKLRSLWLVIFSMICIIVTPFFLPLGLPIKEIAGQLSMSQILLFTPWEFKTFVGPIAFWVYPLMPWLSITLLGIIFGRILIKYGDGAFKKTGLVGGAFLLIFAAMRFAGSLANINTLKPNGLISFLSITKYPPSITFILLTLGILFLMLAMLNHFASHMSDKNPLVIFGRVPLFYYMLHLALFSVMGKIISASGYAVAYGAWGTGIILLYFPCKWCARFKKSTSMDSIWRLF
ncbi:MAG: heparan-alpha-glucosaminide N-acetyltransferase domain-containing protein [Aminobacterium sp.]|uniref:DUF1624 domain-containing protein n=1 Tax=Aminobacterium sp. TaxID=1872491 RepID=UPI002B1E995C|nr:heparan-alpha-glucosaminide N-acetyltransferase domain-containing protein [Aminobacterium sp.]MEA4878365.1 heparan-alpha-glucosaminide N-acetyltransferase domain-containing protein [Aminobacterium sp.]